MGGWNLECVCVCVRRSDFDQTDRSTDESTKQRTSRNAVSIIGVIVVWWKRGTASSIRPASLSCVVMGVNGQIRTTGDTASVLACQTHLLRPQQDAADGRVRVLGGVQQHLRAGGVDWRMSDAIRAKGKGGLLAWGFDSP